jgi:hypothetical protein
MRSKPVHQTAFPSLSRAANTYYSQEFDNSGAFFGLLAFTDLTVRGGGGTGTLTVTLEGYDLTSGKWYTLIAGSTLSSVTTQPLLTYPGATVVANQVGQWPVPSKFRVKAVVATDLVTFSVGIELVP